MEYWDPNKRFSSYGHEWRVLISKILEEAGLSPRVKVYENGNPANMIEALWWKKNDKYYLGLIKNPTENRELAALGKIYSIQGITGQEIEISLDFESPVGLVNLRRNEHLGVKSLFQDQFKPWQGNLYKVTFIDGE